MFLRSENLERSIAEPCYVILKRPEWLGRSFILAKFTLARETFGFKRFGSFQLPSSVNNYKHSRITLILL